MPGQQLLCDIRLGLEQNIEVVVLAEKQASCFINNKVLSCNNLLELLFLVACAQIILNILSGL